MSAHERYRRSKNSILSRLRYPLSSFPHTLLLLTLLQNSDIHVALFIHLLFLVLLCPTLPLYYHLNWGKPPNLSGTRYAMKTSTLPYVQYPVPTHRRHHHHHRLLKTRHLQPILPFLGNHLPKRHPLLNPTTRHGLHETQHDLFLTHAPHRRALPTRKKLQGLLLMSKRKLTQRSSTTTSRHFWSSNRRSSMTLRRLIMSKSKRLRTL
jgi:hypothetical protein